MYYSLVIDIVNITRVNIPITNLKKIKNKNVEYLQCEVLLKDMNLSCPFFRLKY